MECDVCDACRPCRECGFVKPLDDMRLALKNGTWVCDMCVRGAAGSKPHYPGKRLERDVDEEK